MPNSITEVYTFNDYYSDLRFIRSLAETFTLQIDFSTETSGVHGWNNDCNNGFESVKSAIIQSLTLIGLGSKTSVGGHVHISHFQFKAIISA